METLTIEIAHEQLIEFGTKSETLARLSALLKSAKVLPQLLFLVSQWQAKPAEICQIMKSRGWFDIPVIVRSSSSAEDSATTSGAGCYESVLDVLGPESFEQAVNKVIASYGGSGGDEQVFVQPMLSDVIASGVAFGFDPNTHSPYSVVSYSESSADTTAVTSGTSNALRTFYVFGNSNSSAMPPTVQAVQVLLNELSQLFGTAELDIEFALDAKGELYLFQCRQLLKSDSLAESGDLKPHLERIAERVRQLSQPHPYLFGARSIFGIMPDWNPAEIIGTRPRPLALSLYRELITDSIWAYQRNNYGYRNLRSFPLLISFCGLPYVDVRVDFNSFIPAEVEPELGNRLVNYYLDKLAANPNEHDKVEFEVVFTCYTFDLPERITQLSAAGFSTDDQTHLMEHLRRLTTRIIRGKEGLWHRDDEKIKRLIARQKAIHESELDLVSKIYWLLEDCKRYGTLPFAGLARAGFIAVQMLKSLVNVGVLTRDDYDQFMSSLDTVSSRMKRDFHNLSRSGFLDIYGHLRPGTYDILSPRYDEAPERYFDWSNQNKSTEEAKRPAFGLSLNQFKQIQDLLDKHQLEYDVLGFFEFLQAAIEGREFSKFIFTKSLSDALSLFAQLGQQHGFSPDDCSFARADVVERLYSSAFETRDLLSKSIAQGRKDYDLTCRLRLPPLIVDPADVWCFEMPTCDPNFVTQKSVTAPTATASKNSNLGGHVVFIPSADPGFDWIFSHGISGLITMYGGVNSHMAIRAGELSIPAVIGTGEVLYTQWSQYKTIQLDCRNRQVLKVN